LILAKKRVAECGRSDLNKRLAQRLNDPLASHMGQFAIAIEFIDFMLMPGQHAHNGFTACTKSGNGLPQ
jgi:hypothetical protein